MKTRTIHALRAAIIHLLLSVALAGVVAFLVFGFWFPFPLREVSGGGDLFWLIVGVDVVCGPLLTFVVFNPSKPRMELRRDLTLVGLVQLLALFYGVHTLSYARPVALVHEVDRIRVLSYSDLVEADASNAPAWAQPWSLERPHTVGVREATTPAERTANLDASLQGVETSQRPSWWQDYALSVSLVLARARPLAELRAKHPAQTASLDAAVADAIANPQAGESIDPAALRWLPLVGRHAMDWVVLLDPTTARIRGYAHLDGF